MERVLKLSNENHICSSKLTYKNITKVNNDFSLHVKFNGNEKFVLNKKNLRLLPHTLLAINPGTLYSDIIDSDRPVQILSISFGKGFINDFIYIIFISGCYRHTDCFNRTLLYSAGTQLLPICNKLFKVVRYPKAQIKSALFSGRCKHSKKL
jgi:hypothetical protein